MGTAVPVEPPDRPIGGFYFQEGGETAVADQSFLVGPALVGWAVLGAREAAGQQTKSQPQVAQAREQGIHFGVSG